MASPDAVLVFNGSQLGLIANGDGTYALQTSNGAASGGGVQYTEGDTDSTITGTAVLWEDTSDTLRVASASKPLPTSLAPASTASVSAVADASTNQTLLVSSASRRGFRIQNDSDQVLYVKYGATATTTDFTYYLLPGAVLFEDNYYGQVDGIWAANSTGSARVTSLS